VNYSIQFAPATKRKRAVVVRRAEVLANLRVAFLAAHPGRTSDSVTVLEVSLWQASRR